MLIRSTSGHPHRWPKALRHDGRDFLTTAQVARVLGVKAQSVYAYVSRGQLNSVRIAGVRGSLFAVGEVEAFRRRTQRRPPAGIVERIHTEITLIAGEHLYYRGTDATDLARSADFVDVAQMLWGTSGVSSSRVTPAVRVPRVPGRRIDTIRVVVDLLGAGDPQRHDQETEGVARRALNVLDAVVDALPVLGATPPADASIARRLWPRLSPMAPSARRVTLLNAALVLLADHDLAAGTIAARVAASARGSIYAVISAGLGAFDGPLHGGATTLAYGFLSSVLADAAGPDAAVASYLREHDRPPGCGHVIYRHRDPRGEALLQGLAGDSGGRDVLAAVDAVRAGVSGSGGGFVNSDLALAAIALRYRMVDDAAETIFAVARIAGWVAHAIEEYHEPRLRYRPEGVYTGVRPAG
ncbi:citrate synthase [Williamsia maris]|uniref:citrate synthase (unknown stereospecificity) n=1 Tax=Williamsia maris TaxID=72806 RepID=A0ABT1HII1_9NOCA|nr:citrate synthase [Williamsia maris]MCP2177744.1 citrate synthase [Williamsia maris]